MIRRFLNCLTLASLVLCAAIAILWVRSYVHRYAIECNLTRGNQWRVVSYQGQFVVENWRRPDHVVTQNFAAEKEQIEKEYVMLHEWQKRNLRGPWPLATNEETQAKLWRYAWLGNQLRDVDAKLRKVNGAAHRPRVRTRPVPYVAPAAALLVVAMAGAAPHLIARRRRVRLLDKGLCPRCRYDLRATPACCPECGFTPGPSDRSYGRSTQPLSTPS